MTDLSYFGYDINPSSGADQSGQVANWATDLVVVNAESNGDSVNLCIILQDFSSSQPDFNTFFANSNGQQQIVITKAVNAVIAAHANGINVDFESPYLTTTFLSGYVSFISALSNQLHATVPNSRLSIDLLASQSNTSLLTQLNPYVDLFIMMGYDYYYDGSSTAGPVAPLYAFQNNENVSGDVNSFLQTISSNKFILAMPYYGRTWPTGQSNCYIPTNTTGSGQAVTYTYYNANTSGSFDQPNRDPNTFNPYYCYTFSGQVRQCSLPTVTPFKFFNNV